MPDVKGLRIVWTDQSTWPVEVGSDGTYKRAPKYYGVCDADADASVAGVLEILTEAVWNERKISEHEARKPYPSWIGYLDIMSWGPPVPVPADSTMCGGDKNYNWDESTLSWVPVYAPVES
jgi:hypothetical protein